MSAMLFILLSEKAILFLVTRVVLVGIMLSAGVSLYKLITYNQSRRFCCNVKGKNDKYQLVYTGMYL